MSASHRRTPVTTTPYRRVNQIIHMDEGRALTNLNPHMVLALSVAGNVDGVNYSVLDGIGGLASWDGTIQWQIFLGDPNAGNIVGAGNAVNIVASFDQNANGFDFWNISFDLDVPAAGLVGANTYWLSLHMGGDFLSDSLFWSTQAANGTATGLESNGGNAGPWNTNGTEHWFELTALPAPGALALLAIGAMGVRRRRRE